jgi:hypothetical protein
VAKHPIFIPKCKSHPKYKGIKPKKRQCDGCSIVYLSRELAELKAHVLGIQRSITYRYF